MVFLVIKYVNPPPLGKNIFTFAYINRLRVQSTTDRVQSTEYNYRAEFIIFDLGNFLVYLYLVYLYLIHSLTKNLTYHG